MGATFGSMGLSRGQWGSGEIVRGQLELSGVRWCSVRVSGVQWGISGSQWGSGCHVYAPFREREREREIERERQRETESDRERVKKPCFLVNLLSQVTSCSYNTNRNQMSKILFYKNILNLAHLWKRAKYFSRKIFRNKREKCFSLSYHQLAENDSYFWFLRKGKKGIKVNVSRVPCEIFATQCFFTDHLSTKP